MLKSRRYNASQALLSTNSVNRWFKHLDGPITKTLPNGIEKEIKGSLQKNTRTRQEKRTRGQMSNNCHFRSNKAVDYGDASEKYNYSKNQQSSVGNQDSDRELSEENQILTMNSLKGIRILTMNSQTLKEVTKKMTRMKMKVNSTSQL